MRNYTNYADMITFSRASSGTALAKISYGPELVTNGTFDTDTTGWSASSATISVVNGELEVVPSVSTYGAYQNVTVQSNKTYEVTLDARAGTGSPWIRLGYSGILSSQYVFDTSSTTGARKYIIRTTGTQLYVSLGVTGTSTTGYFDNISVKEVFYDQPDGTLQLFNYPTNKPRVEYDYQGNRLGLLVEEARTNYNPNSDNFSLWTKTNTTESNGLVTATAVNNTHRISRAFSGFSGAVVSWADMKFGTHRYVQIYDGASTQNFATFDLVEGTVTNTGSNTTGFISQIGDGIYRCAAAYGTVNPANGNSLIGFANGSYSSWGDTSFDADGTETFYIYRHQLEAGTFPTSYIPTTGATATRSADVASIGVGAFGYNKGAGSVLVVADTISTSADNHQDFRLTGSVGGNSVNSGSRVGSGSAGQYTTWIQGGGSTVALLTVNNTVSDGAQYKASYRFAKNDFALSVSGGSVVSDTTGAMPVSINTLTLGYGYGYLNGHIKSITYYPRRLTDAQIQKLTQVKAVPTLSLTFDGNSDSYLETSIHG